MKSYYCAVIQKNKNKNKKKRVKTNTKTQKKIFDHLLYCLLERKEKLKHLWLKQKAPVLISVQKVNAKYFVSFFLSIVQAVLYKKKKKNKIGNHNFCFNFQSF